MIESCMFPGALFGTKSEVLEMLRAEAVARHATLLQYAGHFEGYELGRATRTIRTKMGVAVENGELVIYKVEKETDEHFIATTGRTEIVVFYSRSNQCDTVCSLKDVVRA